MTISYGGSGADTLTDRGQYSQERAQSPSFFEWVFAAFTLITYQGAFFPVFRTLRQGSGAAFDQAAEAGDPVARYALLAIIIVSLCLCIIHARRVAPVLRMTWPYWIFISLCLLSAAWSDNPVLTLRRSVSLFGSFLFAAYAFAIFGPRRFILLTAVVGGVAAFSSIVLLVLEPELAYDPSYFVTGAMRGVYAQKNQMSVYGLLGLCAAISALFFNENHSDRVRNMLKLSAFMMFVTLMLSRGLSSIIAFGVVLFVLIAYYDKVHWRVRLIVGYFLLTVIILAGFVVLVDPGGMLSLVDRDATLTGRLPLWIESIKAITLRPLLGYGYQTFWDADSIRTRYIWQSIGWPAPGAHDGFLDLTLGVGIIGAGFYAAVCGRAAILAAKYAKFNVPGVKWFVLYCAAIFIVNIDEGTLAWPDAIAIQMVFGYCLVEAFLAQRRLI